MISNSHSFVKSPMAMDSGPVGTYRGAIPALGVLVFLCSSFVVPHLRAFPGEELIKTLCWSVAVLAACWGWGRLLAEWAFPARPLSLALVAVWGASLLVAFGGVLAALSALRPIVLLGFTAVGNGLAGRFVWTDRLRVDRKCRAMLRAARLQPGAAMVFLVLAAAVALIYLGGASDTSSNPYDDDISYYPFVRQLIDRGTLIDPFSFRRMSTLGGQAFLQALLAIRIPIRHLNVFDRSICFLLTTGLVASHRVRGRSVPWIARCLSVAFLCLLPNRSINSASYWSGAAFFLALYQTMDLLPVTPLGRFLPTVSKTFPLLLVGVAICTLRQNYQATVVIVLATSYVFLAWNRRHSHRLADSLIEAGVAMSVAAALLIPWLALLYRSNDTFLFPLMKGTFRAGVEVRSATMTLSKHLRFFLNVWGSPEPIYTFPFLMFVGLALPRDRGRETLLSQWWGAVLSIAVLSASFSLSDAGNLARYDFGFITATTLITWHSALTLVHLPLRVNGALPAAIASFCVISPMVADLPTSRLQFDRSVRDAAEILRRTVTSPKVPSDAVPYQALQQSIPSGEPLLVMVDKPYHFDFGRNVILNLDMPGTASPAPGIPAFQGPEPVAEYLRGLGIRYVAFVRPKHSAFLYRDQVWKNNIFNPEEIWRIYAPYIFDVMSNLELLAGSRKIVFEADNMVLMDVQSRM